MQPHSAWALAAAAASCFFAIAYAASHAPQQPDAQVECIKLRGKWEQGWGGRGTCLFQPEAKLTN